MRGRPPALAKHKQADVISTVRECGSIKSAAKKYGVHPDTLSRYIGGKIGGVKSYDIDEIRQLAKTHTAKQLAEWLGYTECQIRSAAKINGIKLDYGRKPRSNSKLTHEEMHNMDVIVKQFDTVLDCAVHFGVCTRTIEKHARLCRESKSEKPVTVFTSVVV